MAFTASSMFSAWTMSMMGKGVTTPGLPASYAGLLSDAVLVALYGNSGTPDKDATIANTGYNTGAWVTGNEITGSGIWAAGGRTLAGGALTQPGSGVMMWDATDLAGAGTGTLSAVFGCLVYDNTITAGTGGVAKQGVCFNFFGGSQSVTSGTFTIIWSANGVARITSS